MPHFLISSKHTTQTKAGLFISSMKQFSISRTVIECISTHLKLASDFVKASCQALIFFFFQQSPHCWLRKSFACWSNFELVCTALSISVTYVRHTCWSIHWPQIFFNDKQLSVCAGGPSQLFTRDQPRLASSARYRNATETFYPASHRVKPDYISGHHGSVGAYAV